MAFLWEQWRIDRNCLPAGCFFTTVHTQTQWHQFIFRALSSVYINVTHDGGEMLRYFGYQDIVIIILSLLVFFFSHSASLTEYKEKVRFFMSFHSIDSINKPNQKSLEQTLEDSDVHLSTRRQKIHTTFLAGVADS